MTHHQRPNATMQPGDEFISHNEVGEPIAVTVVRPPQPHTDRFGRSLYRAWCGRSDTGAEGWLAFGWADDLPTPPPPRT